MEVARDRKFLQIFPSFFLESDNTESGSSSRSKTKRMTVSGTPTSGSFKTPTTQNNDMPPPKLSQSRSNYKSSPSQLAGKSSGKKSSIYVSPVIINDSEDDEIDLSLRRSGTGNSYNLSGNSSRVSLSGVGGGDSSYYDSSLRNGNAENEIDDEDDGNSTSDYTRRLLQFRNDQRTVRRRPTSHLMPRSEPMNENDIVYHAEPSLEPAQIPLNIAIRNFINRLDEYYGLRQTIVPYMLLLSLVLFFIVIVCFYITMRPDIQNTISLETTMFTKCDLEHESAASYSCIEENHLNSSLVLLKRIGHELQSRAMAKNCDQETSISMLYCVKDILKPGDLLQQLKDVHNCEYLIDNNPHWGIQNVDVDGGILSLDQVLHKRADHENCFTIKKPKLPLKCVIYSKLQTFFLIIGFVGIVGVLGYLGNLFYKFVVQVKEKRRELVQKLITDIINSLLEKTMIDKENPVVVITHLRDKLIDPAKRKEHEWAWVDAIKYLEKNDSRIQFELKNINGEDFKVMRWIDETKSQNPVNQSNISISSPQIPNVYNGGASNRMLKKWIGPAFDKTNKIKDPPTQCLKIRQMFDKYDTNDSNLQQMIQDAILTKLHGKNCRILDIQLDVKTCCVYVKCESNADAVSFFL